MPDVAALPDPVQTTLSVALIAVVALAAFFVLRMAVEVGVRGLLERRATESGAEAIPPVELERRVKTIARLLVRIAGVSLLVIAVLMALGQLDIDVGPAIAGLGVVGIAVGFGAQTLIKDWLAGIFIVLENQYSEGDVVRIAGVEGVVESFGLRRTTLRDLDGTVHNVPNGQITVASNLTRLWASVSLDVSLADDTDVDRATSVINDVGSELREDPEWGPRMLEAPSVTRVDARADSQVTLTVLGQVRAAERSPVASELRKRILAAFGPAGLETPAPHQVIVNRGALGRELSPAADGDVAPDPTAPAGPAR